MSPARRLRLVVRCMAWAAALPVLKVVFPAQRLARLMWRDPRVSTRDRQLERERIMLVGRLYRRGRIPRPHNCLERSLLAYRLLSEVRADPVLVLGLHRDRGVRHGHAWVLVDSSPVDTGDDLIAEMEPVLTFGRGGALLPTDIGSGPAVPA